MIQHTRGFTVCVVYPNSTFPAFPLMADLPDRFGLIARDLITRGIAVTSEPSWSVGVESGLRSALDAFLARPFEYRDTFAHARFSRTSAYDGYSYHGQAASECANQYPTDMLHSFVLSDCAEDSSTPCGCSPDFPAEFDTVTAQATWRGEIMCRVDELEAGVCAALDRALCLGGGEGGSFSEMLTASCCHMISCNRYPPMCEFGPAAKAASAGYEGEADSTEPPQQLRLSEHVDVSLLTVFPFGLGAGFSFRDPQTRALVTLSFPIRTPVVFAGQLAELLSAGRVPALRHCVALPRDIPGGGDEGVRYSFACFSIPRFGRTLRLPADIATLLHDGRMWTGPSAGGVTVHHDHWHDSPSTQSRLVSHSAGGGSVVGDLQGSDQRLGRRDHFDSAESKCPHNDGVSNATGAASASGDSASKSLAVSVALARTGAGAGGGAQTLLIPELAGDSITGIAIDSESIREPTRTSDASAPSSSESLWDAVLSEMYYSAHNSQF